MTPSAGPSWCASRSRAVCYVLPHWSPGEASHYALVPELLAEIGARCDLHVIVQRGEAPPLPDHVRSVHRLRARTTAGRMLELACLSVALRRQGCRRFFVRISVTAALVLGLLGRLLGFEVHWWVSGQGENRRPPWRQWRSRLRTAASEMLSRVDARLVHRLVTGPERMVVHYARRLRLSPRRLTLLYNDVPAPDAVPRDVRRRAARAALGWDASTDVVLFVGRVSPLKGGHNLPDLAGELRALRPRARLVVVGDLSPLPDVPRACADRGLRNVLFVGGVSHDAVARYFDAADVFVLPSESEGCPRVVLEALRAGVPVAAFDVGGVRDLLPEEQQSDVVERGDVAGLARRVAALLAAPDVARRKGAAGERHVERYATARVAEMFVARVVEGRG